MSLWAAVPHYVSQPPNPKATLALLNRLEDLIGLRIPLGELTEDARAWQLGVDQLAAEDSEVAEYVQTLEEARDTAELPEASGEAIAREFERYLRRRDGNPRDAGPTAPGQPPAAGTTGPAGRTRPPRPQRGGHDDQDARDTDGVPDEKDTSDGTPDEGRPDNGAPDNGAPDNDGPDSSEDSSED